jgi:acyl-CoA thioesterase-2
MATQHDDRPLDGLIELLDLEPIEVNIFRGRSPDEERQRVFGGQVAGQALVAAGRTVEPDRRVHSLHAYFLRPGDPNVPILYEVDRIRDGKSFTTRRVVAIQHGRAIFNLSSSFHVAEPGLEHQLPMPEVPAPESLPTFHERMEPYAEQMGEWFSRPRPIDTRFVQEPWRSGETGRAARQDVWMRADGSLPEDPLLHACVVAYASDMTLLDSVLLPHNLSWEEGGIMMASLDHAMWFHRPFRADEWLLYSQESPAAAGARGLARGSIFRADGVLTVSVVQEGLVRVLDRP